MQPGTKEHTCKTVEMKEIDGSTLKHLVSFMYGQNPPLNTQVARSRFVAADAHQVPTVVAALVFGSLCAYTVSLYVCRCKSSAGFVYNT